ncbi:MAG: L,D-transpeptidase [Anaerolineaceae bacterium]|nr:L,D-transpeptidase [Anaerolineaceae bacterium]
MTKSSKSPFSDPINRREFLQFCGFGLAGLALPEPAVRMVEKTTDVTQQQFGRITINGLKLFSEPNFGADVLDEMHKDMLWKITGTTIGGDETNPNRIWYELDGKGYAYSGWVQPVMKQYNPVRTYIPEGGRLGEVTVPFVDAYNSMEIGRQIKYRFYYASTFWVTKRIVAEDGQVWYQLLDDKFYQSYYVPARTIRLVPDVELTAISPELRADEKSILVDLNSQMLTAYENDRIVFQSRISSGVRLSEGGFATPRGLFHTMRKRPCRHMSNPPNEYGSGFDLPGVPWVSYFTGDGIAFHGAYWHNNYGVPSSHGCINMAPQAAKWIYRWTLPTVPPDEYVYSDAFGTRVLIQ